MKIEADFAPRDHALVVDEFFDLLFGGVVVKASIVRMGADRCVDTRVLPADVNRSLECVAVRIACANIKNQRNARGLSALDDRVAIDIKLRTINMSVRVDEHA